MFEFFKRKPKEETVSAADHVRIVAEKVGQARKGIIAEYAAVIGAAQESARLSDAALQEAVRELQRERKTIENLVIAGCALRDRLREIAALETPNCAHIGKRMARIARNARGEDAQAREKGEVA